MAGKSPQLSIIICTRNRAFILPDCLNSLLEQTVSTAFFELIVVDNASADETPEVADSYRAKFAHSRYIREQNIGLSYARNTGYREATGDWIIYLDDDARAASNFVERAQYVIDSFDFDCFGGVYSAWFKYGRPHWLPENFGTKGKLLEQVGFVKDGFVSGGIMAVKRSVMRQLEGFSSTLGMGKMMGYGEEDELQIRMRKAGYQIGFDPEWSIDHCVLPDKLMLSWHFRSTFARGRDQMAYATTNSTPPIFWGLLRSVAACFWKLPLKLFRWAVDRNYYWQNICLDLLQPIAFRFGQLYSRLTLGAGKKMPKNGPANNLNALDE